MPRMPKRVKHRKQQRSQVRGKATRGNYIAYGEHGIQALESAWLSARQIEAGRIAITHAIRREGKVYVRAFPDKPITKKPLETRMGKGKAEVEYWAAPIKPGRVLYEISGVSEDVARMALGRVAQKMPVRTRMVYRRHAA